MQEPKWTFDHTLMQQLFRACIHLPTSYQNGELLLQVYQYCIYVNYSSELLSQPNPEVLDDA